MSSIDLDTLIAQELGRQQQPSGVDLDALIAQELAGQQEPYQPSTVRSVAGLPGAAEAEGVAQAASQIGTLLRSTAAFDQRMSGPSPTMADRPTYRTTQAGQVFRQEQPEVLGQTMQPSFQIKRATLAPNVGGGPVLQRPNPLDTLGRSLEDAGISRQQDLAAQMPTRAGEKYTPEWFIRTTFNSMPQMAASMATAAGGSLVGGPVGGFLGGAIPTFTLEAGQEAQQVYEARKQQGATDDEALADAFAPAVVTGLINAGIEQGGVQGELRDGIVKRFLKTGFGEWLKTTAEEGAEEVVQNTVSTIAQGLTTGKWPTLAEFADDTLQNFLGGAAAGGIMSAGTHLAFGSPAPAAPTPQVQTSQEAAIAPDPALSPEQNAALDQIIADATGRLGGETPAPVAGIEPSAGPAPAPAAAAPEVFAIKGRGPKPPTADPAAPFAIKGRGTVRGDLPVAPFDPAAPFAIKGRGPRPEPIDPNAPFAIKGRGAFGTPESTQTPDPTLTPDQNTALDQILAEVAGQTDSAPREDQAGDTVPSSTEAQQGGPFGGATETLATSAVSEAPPTDQLSLAPQETEAPAAVPPPDQPAADQASTDPSAERGGSASEKGSDDDRRKAFRQHVYSGGPIVGTIDGEHDYSDYQTFDAALERGKIADGMYHVGAGDVVRVVDGKATTDSNLVADYDYKAGVYRVRDRSKTAAVRERTFYHGTRNGIADATQLKPGTDVGPLGDNRYRAVYATQNPDDAAMFAHTGPGARVVEMTLAPGAKIATFKDAQQAQREHPSLSKEEALKAAGFAAVGMRNRRGEWAEIAIVDPRAIRNSDIYGEHTRGVLDQSKGAERVQTEEASTDFADVDSVKRFLASSGISKDHDADAARIVEAQRIVDSLGHRGTDNDPSLRHEEYRGEAERAALRQRVTDELINQQRLEDDDEIKLGQGGTLPKTPLRQERKFFLVLGPPAAGKSGIANKLSDAHGARIVDNDYAKRKIPEFEDRPEGAALVHEESATIAEQVLKHALTNGDNIVYPKLGNDSAKMAKLAAAVRDLGYSVHVVSVQLPIAKSVERAAKRFLKSGRYIPLGKISETGTKPEKTYTDLRANGYSGTAISTDVERGHPPRDVEGDPFQQLLESGKRRGAGSGSDSGDAGGNEGRQEGRPAASPATEEVGTPDDRAGNPQRDGEPDAGAAPEGAGRGPGDVRPHDRAGLDDAAEGRPGGQRGSGRSRRARGAKRSEGGVQVPGAEPQPAPDVAGGSDDPGYVRPAGPDPDAASPGVDPEELAPEDRNYVIPEGQSPAPPTNSKKLAANIAALKLLKKLEQENRNATPEEKAVLASYTGWGWGSEILNEDNERYAKQRAQLEGLMTPDELAQAKASTLNAHYTSDKVVRPMWELARRLGFTGGRVLEPAAGSGNFFGMMPQDLAKASSLVGVELDGLTGRLLTKLYPQADIRVEGFQDAKLANDSFDLAISNVPFGSFKIAGPDYTKLLIHDYFFARGLDKVKPGGLVMFITSDGTMNKLDVKTRKLLAEKADLVGAIRLPNDAFAENAGTAVTTDIIVLRKKDGTGFKGQKWMKAVEVGTWDTDSGPKPVMSNE